MFGIFCENYRKWQQMGMQLDLVTQLFADSDILAGSGSIAVYRALLYFNLPSNLVFKPVRPIKVFSKKIFGYKGAENPGKALNDLIVALEGRHADQRPN